MTFLSKAATFNNIQTEASNKPWPRIRLHADEPGGHGFQLKQTLAGQEQRERDVRAGMGQWKQLVLEQPAGGPCKEVESSLQSLVSSKQWGGFCKALYFIQSLQLLMRLVREASYSWVPAQCFEHRRHSRNHCGINPSSFSKGKIKALKMPAFPGHHSLTQWKRWAPCRHQEFQILLPSS